MISLRDRVVLVAGAASGIGAATARLAHELGARVFCADRNLAGARATAASLTDASAFELAADSDASWQATLASVLEAAGHLDVLVNSVGISAAGSVAETPLAEWRRVLATNLDGAFLATQHALRTMGLRGGAIIHLGSASGIRPAAGAAAYSTSKAALRMLVAVAAKECRTQNLPIRVNLVSPAGVKTPLWSSMPFFQDLVRTTGSETAAFEHLARAGGSPFSEPEDVARVVCFLASDAARHINGAELPVDDGFVL